VMAVAIFIPFSPLAPALGMQALPMSYFPFLFAILLSYCLLTQLVKTWYIRKFNDWL